LFNSSVGALCPSIEWIMLMPAPEGRHWISADYDYVGFRPDGACD
jgi:hypothetical protein